ncbi:MAG: DUF937 domain-containing protein [Gemmatimonadaceae bacterium]
MHNGLGSHAAELPKYMTCVGASRLPPEKTMSSSLDSIEQQVTSTAVQQVSQRLGIDPAVAQQTISAAIPVITSALAKRAQSGAADAIHREATKQASAPAAGNPLPQVLGDQHSDVQRRISDAAGISSEDAGKILGAIAPAVMRGIGEHVQREGIAPNQLADVLNSRTKSAR